MRNWSARLIAPLALLGVIVVMPAPAANAKTIIKIGSPTIKESVIQAQHRLIGNLL